jgi:hypothetical protein
MTARFLVLYMLILFLPIYASAGTTIPVLVKESINANGQIPLTMTLYDAPKLGLNLYQTNKIVVVADREFVEIIEVPSEALQGRSKVYVEFTRVGFPLTPLNADRMPFAIPPSQQTATLTQGATVAQAAAFYEGAHVLAAESVCYTCGGAYPYQAGALATRSGGPNIERGRGCGGSLHTTTSDSRPFICYGTCLQQAKCSFP